MQRERITQDIYVFTSDQYAHVTAGVVLTSAGAVVVDALLYPEETLAMKRFIEERLGARVVYVVNTNFRADHTTGTCFFPGAEVVAHRICRELLNGRGRESMARIRAGHEEMRDLELVLPTIVFEERLALTVGNKTLELWHTPGHSPDAVVCLVKEDQVLFAGDTLMPLPYIVDGDLEVYLETLESLRNHGYEHIVQGHGEVILRGEVEEKIAGDITYLKRLRDGVRKAVSAGREQALHKITIEKCGKSCILLNGLAEELHRRNLTVLAGLYGREAQIEAERNLGQG